MDTVQDSTQALLLETIRCFREPAMLLRQEPDGTYAMVFVTEAFADLMECSVAEAEALMAGTGYLTSTHQEDRIFVRRMLRRRVNEEGGPNLTVRKTTAKGQVRWCDVHYSFIDICNTHYVYCTYFDITTLKEYEQRLRNAYANLGDNFYQAGQSTLSLFRVNLSRDAIEDMQGRDLFDTDSSMLPYSAVLRKRAESCPVPEERDAFLENFDPDELSVAYLKGRSQVNQTFYSRRPDGEGRYVRMTANTTRHPMTGDIIAFLSEEEANQTKVRETLLERILVRQFDMVAWLADGRYGVVIGDGSLIEKGSIFPLARTGDYRAYLNSQVAPVLHGTEEARQAMLCSLLPETVDAALRDTAPYVASIAVDVDGEIWYKRFDFYPVDPDSRFCVVLKSDTTSIRMEQLRLNTQLSDALEEARQANVAKTAFLSRMSHEIRTPMNAIIGLNALALREENLPDSLKDYLTKIGSSAKYLLSLINDILDMSRIESGRMTLKMEEFSFSALLDLVNTMADGQCRERGLHYDCVVHGTVDEFYIGDDTKLRQVLINILGNAVKFTNPGGSVSLTVERVSSFDGQSVMRFAIRDSGIGMDKEYIPRIFEPFSQEDSSNTSRYGGSGLGLAITKNIVSMLNGDITVESEKHKGSTFTVTVPLREAEGKRSARSLDINAKDLRVLIIDDDPVACRHAHAVLEEIGIASETCLSGAEALKLIEMSHARREDFNLILVDLRMPEQDGVTVTREIRRLMGDEAAIIILTAYNWDEVENEARNAGVDSFMSKPLFATNVLQEFQQTVRRKRTAEEKEATLADLNGRRILLAEDMLINAEIMKELLSVLGMEVEHAANGQMAVDMFSYAPLWHYDAVLMDVRMPVLDGLAATRGIRALDRPDARLVPIIAMTANAFDEDVQLSLQAGMNAHLTKPVEPDHLTQTLASLIGRYDKERAQ
ncbi:MAG: response regulator [Desulfovibrio sp.]|nr:response regulator [Desulfovibrio sp.]